MSPTVALVLGLIFVYLLRTGGLARLIEALRVALEG
jgi:hypothetical protein